MEKEMLKLGAKLAKTPLVSTLEGVWKGFGHMASNEKIPKMVKKIGTHSGVFHCDEALACFMLKQLPEYENAEIVRSREENVLNNCDIVVDVGGIYDHKVNRYDHHQRSFNETFSTILPHIAKDKTIRLSSAGLVYVHYGMEVIEQILKKRDFIPSSDCLSKLFLALYEGFVEELDAIDNGIPMYADGHPRYTINTHLGARVHKLNPNWNSPNTVSLDDLFKKAMDLVGSEFTEKVVECAMVWWPAREVVKKAIKERYKLHPSGKIIELKERCPWKEHVKSIEQDLNIVGELKFVIFHDATDSWRVQGIPVQPDSFVCRVFLHEDWKGVRDSELSTVSGIDGCIFCHSSGFIGGNRTREGVLTMALKSLAAVHDRD